MFKRKIYNKSLHVDISNYFLKRGAGKFLHGQLFESTKRTHIIFIVIK